MVKPGASLSLQSHFHRSEHWVAVKGTLEVTKGGNVELLAENQSTYIPIGEKHLNEVTDAQLTWMHAQHTADVMAFLSDTRPPILAPLNCMTVTSGPISQSFSGFNLNCHFRTTTGPQS